MSNPFKPSRSELEDIKEFEMRIKDELPSSMKEDETLFYRFLKARDFDVDKAEIMLRNSIAWRKSFQVDKILDTFKPKEVFLKYIGSCLLGLDKEGNLVRYGPTGKVDSRDLANSIKLNDYMKHCIWTAEYDTQFGKLQNTKSGRKAHQEIFIFNLDGLTFANATSKLGADLFLRMIHLLQDNYPECMKYLYVINAPVFFAICFSIIKKVMSNAMIKKIHIFGHDGWKEALLEEIDADVLPAFLGGKRTDPDGDPSCKTSVLQGGRIPSEYFISDQERHFKDMSQVERVTVPASADHKILVEVGARGSVIRWEFETKNKDIGFGLFYQKSEEELEDVLPIQRFVTNDGTETGFYECQAPGAYFIIFDNSHSWLNSKEVLYCVSLEIPDT